MVPECKPEWNREAITVFSRLLNLMAADKPCPQLQPSLNFYTFFFRPPGPWGGYGGGYGGGWGGGGGGWGAEGYGGGKMQGGAGGFRGGRGGARGRTAPY